jgi:hypothetical protein
MLERLFARLPWRRERALDAAAREIADLCLDEVCRAVSERVFRMGLGEARGYIRARSMPQVRRHSPAVLNKLADLPAGWEPLVLSRAADCVAPLALRRITARRPQAARSGSGRQRAA